LALSTTLLSRARPGPAARTGPGRHQDSPSSRGRVSFSALALPVVVVVVTVAVVVAALVVLAVMSMTVSVLRVLRRAAAAGDVDLVVPALLDEIDALSASVVLTAVLLPLLGVSGRHAQVDRRPLDGNRDGRWLHDHRLLVDHRRRRPIADLDPAVDP